MRTWSLDGISEKDEFEVSFGLTSHPRKESLSHILKIRSSTVFPVLDIVTSLRTVEPKFYKVIDKKMLPFHSKFNTRI